MLITDKKSASLLGLSCFLAAAPALAAPDLRVEIPSPAPQYVHEDMDYGVVVTNIGKHSAAGVSLTIDLPPTHTSPVVHVMGILSGVDARCSRSGARLTCNLGTLAKGQATTVSFTIALPQVAGPLSIAAAATTTSGETNTANNADTDAPSLLYYAVAVGDGATAEHRHCTGTNLTSFYECELYPSSISSHMATFHGDGTVSFPDEPDYSGAWWQDTPDSLSFTYFYGQDVVAEFTGRGTSSNCYEGLTTFPGSNYVSPYEICF